MQVPPTGSSGGRAPATPAPPGAPASSTRRAAAALPQLCALLVGGMALAFAVLYLLAAVAVAVAG